MATQMVMPPFGMVLAKSVLTYPNHSFKEAAMGMPSTRSLFLTALSLALAGSSLQGQEGRRVAHPSAESRTTEGGQSRTTGQAAGTSISAGSSRALEQGGLVTREHLALSPRRRMGADGQPVPVSVVPSFSARCTAAPTAAYWQHRDIFKEIQRAARSGGYLPITEVTDTLTEIKGVALFPAGWKAYGFVVPPSGKLHVRLHHPSEAWFRVAMSNKWGGLEKGMLQNLIPTGNPEATYLNPSATEARAVYVVVDDPGWMSSAAEPYQVSIERSWQPGSFDPKGVTKVQGIWAANKTAETSSSQAGVEASRSALAQ